MPLELPAQSFDAIAVDLLVYARSAHQAHAAGEVMLARGGWGLGFEVSLQELEAAAAIAGGVYAFFREAAPYEAEIRAFLSSLPERVKAEDAAA